MHDANDAHVPTGGLPGDTGTNWPIWPTIKQRTAVQHAVERLLDDLAPERAPPRLDRPAEAVQRHRSPRGCILQAESGAVSVSWFPAAATDAGYGELQVIIWRGTVSRPGAARKPGPAAVALRQVLLEPIEISPDKWGWRTPDAVVFEGSALVARCLELLDEHRGPSTTVRKAG